MHVTEHDTGFIARCKSSLINNIKEIMSNWNYLEKYEISAFCVSRFLSSSSACLSNEHISSRKLFC